MNRGSRAARALGLFGLQKKDEMDFQIALLLGQDGASSTVPCTA